MCQLTELEELRDYKTFRSAYNNVELGNVINSTFLRHTPVRK